MGPSECLRSHVPHANTCDSAMQSEVLISVAGEWVNGSVYTHFSKHILSLLSRHAAGFSVR